MLFRKVQKSQQNTQSTSLKVKKVTSRLLNCESLFRMTVCQVLVQIFSRGHYQPTYQPPEGVYLLIVGDAVTPHCEAKS